MAVDGKLSVALNFTNTSAYDLGGRSATITPSVSHVFESGTGANQMDLIFSDQRTLTASSTENLDLAGTLLDAFGGTITMAKIKLIYFKAADGNTNDLVIGNVSNGITSPFGAATHSISVRPGGIFLWSCRGTGYTITAGTVDLVKVANGGSGTSVTYDVVIGGTSA